MVALTSAAGICLPLREIVISYLSGTGVTSCRLGMARRQGPLTSHSSLAWLARHRS